MVTETVDYGAFRPSGGPLRFVLIVHDDGAQPVRHVLSKTLRVGKHPDNEVVLESTGVSRHHLELEPKGHCVEVRDLDSKNGTFHNGAKIGTVQMGAGSRIFAGGPKGVELQLELENQPQLAPSAAMAFGPLVGASAAMRSVFTVLERTAPSTATILVTGETGTGKEVVAEAIHAGSPRADGPFVVLDCGAVPHSLIESELFGHIKGAFTDARGDRAGAFEQANGGTLFLDEIGELPLELQPKLLRAVENRSVQRLGENTRREIDVRLVAATHRDLQARVQEGAFRQDLFFRLAVVNVELPPLRDRGQDVVVLARHILERLGKPDAMDFEGPVGQALSAYTWPGNVRELRNALERAIHLGAEHAIPMAQGTPREQTQLDADVDLPFKEAKEQLVLGFERSYVAKLIDLHAGNISAAARDAGIDRNYLHRLLKKHDLLDR